MPDTSRRPLANPRATVLTLAMIASMLCLTTGCVELSRTEKSRYGNPLQGYSSGPRQRFEADDWTPPEPAGEKTWLESLFDW